MANEEHELRKVTDARTLRALAHPVRIALFEELALGGAMTATEIGERIGETADHLLVSPAPAGQVRVRGGGRRRQRPVPAVADDLHRHVLQPGRRPGGADRLRRGGPHVPRAPVRPLRRVAGNEGATYPRPWQDAAINSQYLFYLTAEELDQLSHEVHELLSALVLPRRPAGGPVQAPGRRSAPVETADADADPMRPARRADEPTPAMPRLAATTARAGPGSAAAPRFRLLAIGQAHLQRRRRLLRGRAALVRAVRPRRRAAARHRAGRLRRPADRADRGRRPASDRWRPRR